MKKTYFLDKIHNANNREFERIINAIVNDLNYETFSFTYFKKDNNFWLLEIEKEDELISVYFNDYTMKISYSNKKEVLYYVNEWQALFNKFLNKNQKYYYKKGLRELMEEKHKEFMEIANKDEEINFVRNYSSCYCSLY